MEKGQMSSTMTVDRANDLRARILAGKEPSDLEMQEIISALIADRIAVTEAASAPKASKAKKEQAKIDLNDLLSE